MSQSYERAKPVMLLGLACCFVFSTGCRRDARLRSCLQTQIPQLLEEAEKAPVRTRPALLRRQLIRRCATMSVFLKDAIGGLSHYRRNALDDREDRSKLWRSMQEVLVFSRRRERAVIRGYRKHRRRACPQMSDRDFKQIVELLPWSVQMIAITSLCKQVAEQLMPQKEWVAAYDLVPYLVAVAVFVALQDLGVSQGLARRYVRAAGLAQSHDYDIELLKSGATRIHAMWRDWWQPRLFIRKKGLYFRGRKLGDMKAGRWTSRYLSIGQSIARAGRRWKKRRALLCRKIHAYGHFAEPTNSTERDRRKLFRRLLTTAQQKQFPLHRRCSTRVERWFLLIDPATPYQTIVEVMQAAKRLGWEGPQLVVGQKQVPFVGAARLIPLLIFTSDRARALPKTMFHWAVGKRKDRFFLRAVKERQKRRSAQLGLLQRGMGPGGGMYGGGGGWGYGGKKRVYGRPGRRSKSRKRLIRIQLGRILAKGGVSSAGIARVVRRYRYQARFCYESQLRHKPTLSGKITVAIAIARSGKVRTARSTASTMGEKRVRGCLTRLIRRWRFPRSRAGLRVDVSYFFSAVKAHAPSSARFSGPRELRQKPPFSTQKHVFLSAEPAVSYRRIHAAIESMRSAQGKLPTIWLRR